MIARSLVREHSRRQGDPAVGGSTRTRQTAYHQQALGCAAALAGGPLRVRDTRTASPDAGKILLSNVYGWFARIDRGVYDLTETGRQALERWPQAER